MLALLCQLTLLPGFFGAILAGMASDKLFNANRHIPTLIYGIANIAGFALMFWGPQSRVMDAIALSMIGLLWADWWCSLVFNGLRPDAKNAVGAVKVLSDFCLYCRICSRACFCLADQSASR